MTNWRDELQPGTRVYYRGDMANRERFGVIVRRWTDKRFGTFVDIVCDKHDDENEAHEMRGMSISIFSEVDLGHGGTRFVTEAAYHEGRQRRIAESQAYMRERGLH